MFFSRIHGLHEAIYKLRPATYPHGFLSNHGPLMTNAAPSHSNLSQKANATNETMVNELSRIAGMLTFGISYSIMLWHYHIYQAHLKCLAEVYIALLRYWQLRHCEKGYTGSDSG